MRSDRRVIKENDSQIFPQSRCWDIECIEKVTIRISSEYHTEIDYLRDEDIKFLPYDEELMGMSIVERAITLTRLRVWLCNSDSWELFLGEGTLR